MYKVIRANEHDSDLGKPIMEFRLTYAGELKGASSSDTRASHKHEIRKVFHKQLKRLWEIDPFLSNATIDHPGALDNGVKLLDDRINNFQRCGFNFVPLVVEDDGLVCELKILFIRPDRPGRLLESGDLDNRLKTIFDALKVPRCKSEMNGAEPAEGEDPFFCLVDDDRLITNVSIETDLLLEPITEAIRPVDARLVIHVNIRPYRVTLKNIDFG